MASHTLLGSREEWGKKVSKLEKEHLKYLKKKKNILKSKSVSLRKVEKKLEKRQNNQELLVEREKLTGAYKSELVLLCQHEQLSVRKIEFQQEYFSARLTDVIKPLLAEELALCRTGDKLNTIISSSVHTREDFPDTHNQLLWFSTPSSSLVGSRTNSFSSVNSFSSSSSSSVSSLGCEEQDFKRVSQLCS